MRDLFAVQVREVDGLPKVNYRFQRRAWEQLQRTLLGKTLLFTDQAGWSDAELVRGYRAQHHVESAFRQLKDSNCIAIRPQYHWTDQKIAVACVLLRAGADAVRPAAAGTEPPRRAGIRSPRCWTRSAGSARSTCCIQRGRRAASPNSGRRSRR